MRVVVLGAAGQLGREVVKALVTRGHSVVAAVRRPPITALNSGARIHRVYARDQAAIREVLKAQDAVVNAIGAGTLRHNEVESSTTAVALAAAQVCGIQRYIAMSAGMVALDWPLFKYVLRPLIFRNILAEHLKVEELVKASALDWTIVRPPKLTNGPSTGYVASVEPLPRLFSATRADVAAFIADELDRQAYVRQAVFVATKR